MEIMATVSFRTFEQAKVIEMLRAGADVLRYNAAHGDSDQFLRRVATAKRAIEQTPSGEPRARLLIDIPGSKIRTGSLDGGRLRVTAGKKYDLVFAGPTRGVEGAISIPGLSLPPDLRPGDKILIGDGEVAFSATEIGDNSAIVTALVDGTFNQGESISFPDKSGYLPKAPILSAAVLGLLDKIRPDYVAISFVNQRDDMDCVRRALSHLLDYAPNLMAKIETSEGLANVDAIVQASDSIMVGRGDLALFSPYERLFLSQELCIDASSRHNKQCWVATQLLDSAAANFVPSRSNICDVGYLASKRIHGLVLSRETGLAERPGHVISVAKKIVEATVKIESEPAISTRAD
jgi:pyruvate kinase